MRITAADGHSTELEVYGVAGKPTALFIPALGVPISYYEPFLSKLADSGLHVHSLELRGMAQSSITNVRRSDFGYHELLSLDIPAAIAAMPTQPGIVVGHSLGGQLALLYAAANPGFTGPIATIASGSSHHSSIASARGRRVRRRQIAAVAAIARVLGYFPGYLFSFGGTQPVSMMSDWAFEAKHARYVLRGNEVDLEAGLKVMPNRALTITLDGDKLIDTGAAALLHGKLTASTLTHVHLDRSANGGEPFDHFRWARRNPEAVVRAITDWL